MTVFSITAPNAADYASELGSVIRDAGTTGDGWYRSNGTGEYLTHAFEVTLPTGVTIDSAVVNYYFPIGSADEPNHTIDAEDVADATRPAGGDANNSISTRTGTTANINWLNSNLGAAGYFDTPDLSTIFQELEDRYDYSSGATVLIRVYYAGTAGDAGIATQAYTGNPVATLTINYTAGGGATHALTISNVATGAPVIGAITAGRNSASRTLTISDVVTGSPAISAITAGRNSTSRALTIADVATGAPTTSAITAARGTGVHALTISDIATGSPTISTITAGRNAASHALVTDGIVTGSPTISTITAGRNSASRTLTISDIVTGSPTIGAITSARSTSIHALTIDDIVTGAPTIGAITAERVSVARNLVLSDIVTGAPTISALSISKYVDALSVDTIITAEINLATISAAINEAIITSDINNAAIGATVDETSITGVIGEATIEKG